MLRDRIALPFQLWDYEQREEVHEPKRIEKG